MRAFCVPLLVFVTARLRVLARMAAAPRGHITLAEYAPGDYDLRTPDFMDCVGPRYSPVWGEFLKEVLDWDEQLRAAQSGGSREQKMSATGLGYKVAGFAEWLRNEWWSTLFDQDTSRFDLVLRGLAHPDSMDGFCMPGFVQALWTRGSIMLEHAVAYGLEGMKNQTLRDIDVGLHVIGHDLRSDYLESTRWPVRGLWLLKTRQEQKPRKLVEWHDQLPPGEDDLPPSSGMDFYAYGHDEAVTPRTLSAVVFGIHAALMSEPMSMVREALPEWFIEAYWLFQKCRTLDPFHHYHCHVFCHAFTDCNPNLYDDMPIRRLFTMIDKAAEGVGEDGSAPTIDEMLDIVGAFRAGDKKVDQADLFVCTVPMLCSLLRGVYAQVPILGYFTMFSFGNPAKEHGAWALMHFAEMAKNGRQNAFAVGGLELSDRWYAQMGIRVPVVRPFGLYVLGRAVLHAGVDHFAALDRRAGELQRTVLITRTPFTVVTTFLHAMRHYVDAVSPEFPLRFTVLKGPRHDAPEEFINFILVPPADGVTLQEALAESRGVFIESSEFVRYRSAVFIPHLPMQFTFNELYSMHVPIFTPTPRWLYKLQLQRNWLPDRSTGREDRLMTVPGPPFVPPAVAGDPYHEFQWLYAKRDEARSPGVQMFGSFPELLEQLLYSDLEAIRETMRTFNVQAFKRAKRWYRGAMLNFFQ